MRIRSSSAALVTLACVLALACGRKEQAALPETPSAVSSGTQNAAGGDATQVVATPGQASVTAVTEPDDTAVASTGINMPPTSQGVRPAGFDVDIRVDPRPGADGVIHGAGQVTVEFDACRSTVGGGKTPFFLFDLNFDHVADVIGTGSACLQERTYRVRPTLTGGPNVAFAANVCVADANPAAHAPSTFVGCRAFHIQVEPAQCSLPAIPFGGLSVSTSSASSVDLDLPGIFPGFNGRISAEGLPPNWSMSVNGVLRIRPTTVGTYHGTMHARTPCGDASVPLTAFVS